MVHKQATPKGSQKPILSDITNAIQLGASAWHFEVWHRGHSEGAITAIWRNEFGPAHIAGQKANP